MDWLNLKLGDVIFESVLVQLTHFKNKKLVHYFERKMQMFNFP